MPLSIIVVSGITAIVLFALSANLCLTGEASQYIQSLMPSHNTSFSFGSGQENPDGLQLKLTFDEDTKSVFGEYRCPRKFQGVEGNVHPGVLSVMLDEIMTRINEAMNFDTVTGELTIRYLQPANTNETLYFRGWFVKKNRRIVELRAEIENEIGKIVARGKGKYIEKEDE